MNLAKIVKYTVVTVGLVLFGFIVTGLILDLVNTVVQLQFANIGDQINARQPATISTTQTPTTAQAPTVKEVAKPAGQSLPIAYPAPKLIASGAGAGKDLPVLVFGKKNTIVFRDVITAQSVGRLQKQLIEMSNKLPASEPIYLALETPGGSIDAGLALIDTAKGLPQEVKTVTFFAASMGFHTVESLGERLIVPSGTLMSHRAKISGLEGQVPGEAVTRLNQILKLTNDMDLKASKRIGMSLVDYQNLIRDEYWVLGEDSVKQGMADKLVLPRCASDLNGTYEQSTMTFFGPMKVTYSDCPLISAPLNVDASEIFKSIIDPTKKAEIQKFINIFISDKRAFTLQYIINRDYTKIMSE